MLELPELPPTDQHGNRPAVAFDRASLARGLIHRMNKKGLSVLELARRTGVPEKMISRILTDKRSADEDVLVKIETALE